MDLAGFLAMLGGRGKKNVRPGLTIDASQREMLQGLLHPIAVPKRDDLDLIFTNVISHGALEPDEMKPAPFIRLNDLKHHGRCASKKSTGDNHRGYTHRRSCTAKLWSTAEHTNAS